MLQPAVAYSLVDQTALIVLRGQVEVQRPSENFTRVTGDAALHIGDRIRTAQDSYAVVTFFDGSTTEIEPETELVLRRLDRLPGGGHNISFHQEIGLTWNRVEKLAGASSRFETTAATTTAFVRGTEYKLRVEASQRTIIEAVTDAVVVDAAIGDQVVQVTVPAGFQTTVEPGQAPSEPFPTAPARFGLRLDVVGSLTPYFTDDRGRSVGFHPQADAFASQIPGAEYRVAGGLQGLRISDPVIGYAMLFKAQGEGGAYELTLTLLVDGQPIAERASGQARPLAALTLAGTVQGGQVLYGQLQVSRTPPTISTTGLRPLNGDPTGRAGFVEHQLRSVEGTLVSGGVLLRPGGARVTAVGTAPPLTATLIAVPRQTPTISGSRPDVSPANSPPPLLETPILPSLRR